MAIFYRGAGVGTWWHVNDPRIMGFTAHSPAVTASTDRLMIHIATGTITSPFISLTRSYGVARGYALMGRAKPTADVPAVVWEVDLPDELPANLRIIDPVKEIASHVPPPLHGIQYQHDGSPSVLIGLIDTSQKHLLTVPRPMPPNSNPPEQPTTISMHLRALLFALRDAEILAIGTIPSGCVVHRHPVVE